MHSHPFAFGDPEEKRYRRQQYYHSSEERISSGAFKTRTLAFDRQIMPSEVPIEPHEHDVLLGRGGRNNQHSGNEILRQLAREQKDKYQSSTKKGKSALSRLLVKKMRELDPPARFLRRVQNTVVWEEVGDDTAREKASQVLRDAVAGLLDKREDAPSPTSENPVKQEEIIQNNDNDNNSPNERESSRAAGVERDSSSLIRSDLSMQSRTPSSRRQPVYQHYYPTDDSHSPRYPQTRPSSSRHDSSVSKRRRYSSEEVNYHSCFDDRQHSVPVSASSSSEVAASSQSVGYSPLRRQSEPENMYLHASRSDPTSYRSPYYPESSYQHHHSYHHYPYYDSHHHHHNHHQQHVQPLPGARYYGQHPTEQLRQPPVPPPLLPPQQPNQPNLDEFELFQGDLLESEEEGEGQGHS